MSGIIKNKALFFVLLFFVAGIFVFGKPGEASAADKYWVGGTGNWSDDDNHWATSSGGAPADLNIPSASDNCIFDTNSNAGDVAYTVTVNASATCLDFTMDGPGSGNNVTWAGSSALAISGSMNLIGGSTDITRTYTGAITFNATTTGKTITTNGLTLASSINFNGVGGGWTLQDNLNNGTSQITITNGALDLNDFTVTMGAFLMTTSATKSIDMTNSTLNVSGTWTINSGAGVTLTTTSSTVNMTGASTTFQGGTKTYATVVFTGGGTTTFSDACTFANLTITGTAVKTDNVVFGSNSNQTITGTLTINGNSPTNRILVSSATLAVSRTLTAATVSVTNADFRDITGAGAGSWDLSAITGGSGDCGGNSGITFTTGQTNYWIGGTGNWADVAEWANSSGGSASSGRVPLPQDDATFDANSFSAGSQTVTQNMPRAGKNINWTGVTNTPTWTTSTAASVFGSLTLVSGMTLTASTQAYTFEGRGTHTITNAGKTWGKGFDFSAPGGTYTLQDALISTGSGKITINNGTFNSNNFDVSSGGTISQGTATRGLIMGSSTFTNTDTSGNIWSLTSTGLTFDAGTSTIKGTGTGSGTKTFLGGGLTYNNLWFTGTHTGSFNISGSNTFNDLKDDGTAAHSLLFTAGTTTTVTTFTVSGTSGNLITVGSITAAGHTLTKAGGGTICSDYLSISRSTATPGSTWYAGNNSTNGGNNSGWTFASCDSTAPVFSSVTPTSSSSINNVTTSSDIAFTTDEALASGSITITRTGGTADGNSPHTCTLTGTALNVGAHTINLSDTTNSCTSDVSNLVSGTVYTFVLAGQDANANVATPITSTSVTFDNTLPTITNVSSDKANGSYTTGEIIDIDVTFSEAVTSTGSVTVTLETGDTDRTCTFTVTGVTTGTCNYTVQAGDTSSDLTVSTISGTIADAAGNAMTNFVPATNLAANKALVIDTTAPSAPGTPDLTAGTDSGSSSTDDITSDTTPDFTISCESSATVTLKEGGTTLGTGACASSTVTITSSALSDGAHAIKALQTDTASNVSSDSSTLSVTIDTTAPIISEVTPVTTPTSDNTPNYTFTTNEAGAISYGGDCTSATSSASSGSNTVTFTTLADDVYSNCTIVVTDAAGNASNTLSVAEFTVDTTAPTVSITAPTDLAVVAGAAVSITADASDAVGVAGVQFKLDGVDLGLEDTTSTYGIIWDSTTAVDGTHTLTAVARDEAGNSTTSTTITVTVTNEEEETGGVSGSSSRRRTSTREDFPIITPIVNAIDSTLDNIVSVIDNFIPSFLKPDSTSSPQAEPEPVVPEITPLVFTGLWNLLPEKAIETFALAPLPDEIQILAAKFPELAETFREVGITKLSDLEKIEGITFKLPGLTERVTLPASQLAVGEFTLPEGIPTSELSSALKKNIPSEFIFSRVNDGLVDLDVALSINDRGSVTEQISTIVGKPLHLVMKPESAVKSVKGYLVFKAPAPKVSKNLIRMETLSASSIFAGLALAEEVPPEAVPIEERFVLQEFEYTDPDKDGIYTADIVAPVVAGEYEVITILDYVDPKLGRRQVKLTTVVDPEGYIYSKIGDQELRLKGATVTIFWQNPDTGEYEIWPAKKYTQENPQITDVRGTYSFLVPEGTYKISVEAKGYKPYKGEDFGVSSGSGVHNNIELLPKNAWRSIFDWKVLIMVVVILLLAFNFYRDKTREKLIKK